MAIINQWGKSAVDATRKNALPPYLDAAFGSFTKDDYLYAKTSSIDLTASAPSADQYNKALIIEDKNGTRFATVEGMRNSSDTLYTMVQCHRTINDSTTYNQLLLGVDSSGNKKVALDDTAWLAALTLTGKHIILGVQSISCTTTDSIAAGASGTCTGARTNVSGASGYWYIPRYCNYGFISGAPSISGTTVSVAATNATSAAHKLTTNVLIIEYKTL